MRISDWSSDVCSSDLLVTAERDAYVAGFTLLAAMGRAEARDLNLFGGTLFGPGFSRKTTPGPPALDIDPDSGIEFVPAAPGHSVDDGVPPTAVRPAPRSQEHTSELQSLMRISYAV